MDEVYYLLETLIPDKEKVINIIVKLIDPSLHSESRKKINKTSNWPWILPDHQYDSDPYWNIRLELHQGFCASLSAKNTVLLINYTFRLWICHFLKYILI